MAGCGGAKSSACICKEEEACVEKKYGGIAPKKPLISKDHERAYFDSADWVLGKQAANSSTRAAVESLKPKLKLPLVFFLPYPENASPPAPPSQADLRFQLRRTCSCWRECSEPRRQERENACSELPRARRHPYVCVRVRAVDTSEEEAGGE
ncbi:hypothetical protein C2845_PM02G28450 [Panicum miliaceum]|uniref:cAMP-regulated phosphoprotein 19-related protein n=1 Tax=Panicum miliaceum TaxID=4540 RepID=A0A3L6SIK9_PANMI|nr:hypothetical protein C2845_PM02G28450 [Panicum miliaceum]